MNSNKFRIPARISLVTLFCLAICARGLGLEIPLVQIRLEVEDLSNNPITQIATGQGFQLSGFVQDLRSPGATGVFAAYLDVTYDSPLATPSGVITHPAPYVGGTSGIATLALIDEVGGFSFDVNPLGPSERRLFQASFNAISVGLMTFNSNPADLLPDHEVLLYGLDFSIPTSEIIYGSVSLTIVPEPTTAALIALGFINIAAYRLRRRR